MYHGIKDEFLQEYLNEFCYKFNRRYFGDRVFDRLIIAAISYKPASSIGCTEVCHLNADNHLRYNGVILSFGEKLSPYELFFGILSV